MCLHLLNFLEMLPQQTLLDAEQALTAGSAVTSSCSTECLTLRMLPPALEFQVCVILMKQDENMQSPFQTLQKEQDTCFAFEMFQATPQLNVAPLPHLGLCDSHCLKFEFWVPKVKPPSCLPCRRHQAVSMLLAA